MMKRFGIILSSLLCMVVLCAPQACAIEYNQATHDSISSDHLKSIYCIVTKGEFNGIAPGISKEELLNAWGTPLYEDEDGYICYWDSIREVSFLKLENNQVKWILCSSKAFNVKKSKIKKLLGKQESKHRNGYIYTGQSNIPVTLYLSSPFFKEIAIGSITDEEISALNKRKNKITEKFTEKRLEKFFTSFSTWLSEHSPAPQ